MARGKSVKVDYKGISAKYNNGELCGVLEVADEETGEVSTSNINLTVEIKDLLKTLNEDDKISINVKEFKPKKESNRKPTFKYVCGCEGNMIKSGSEELNIRCNKCEQDFELIEE